MAFILMFTFNATSIERSDEKCDRFGKALRVTLEPVEKLLERWGSGVTFPLLGLYNHIERQELRDNLRKDKVI